jgi:hypothetical protein
MNNKGDTAEANAENVELCKKHGSYAEYVAAAEDACLRLKTHNQWQWLRKIARGGKK